MFVYIVECSDKSYYVGVTNDVERRVGEHNFGLDSRNYTYNKKPVILKFSEQFGDPIQAIAFEKKLKGWSRKKKESLFQGDWEEIKKLAKSYSSKNSSSP